MPTDAGAHLCLRWHFGRSARFQRCAGSFWVHVSVISRGALFPGCNRANIDVLVM